MTRDSEDGASGFPAGPALRLHTPPPDFDPARADPRLVAGHGLPAPRREDGPAAADFRRAFLAPPPGGRLRFVPALRPEPAPRPGLARLEATTRTHRGVPARRSVNWSGGSLAALGGRSLVGVMARWRVPAVLTPPGRAGHAMRASTWIGLDGQGFYRNASLPQIGTLQAWDGVDGSPARYEAWVQWWARDEANAPLALALTMAPGDAVSAILTVLDPATVRFNLKNETTGTVLQPFDLTAPGGRRVAGASAEWILERPSPLDADGWHPYPLAPCAPVPFTACLAQSRGPGETTLTEHDLARASLIRMIALDAPPGQARTIAYPARVKGDPRALTMTCGAPF